MTQQTDHPGPPARSPALAQPDSSNLADVLERVLDKGVVIAGDIRVDLVQVELLTIRVRLLVASVDRARELGIDWWQHDPMLSSRAEQDSAARQRRLAGAPPEDAAEPAESPDQEPAEQPEAADARGED